MPYYFKNSALYNGNIYHLVFHFFLLLLTEEIWRRIFLLTLVEDNRYKRTKLFSTFLIINIWKTCVFLPAFGARSFHPVHSHLKKENTIFDTVKPLSTIYKQMQCVVYNTHRSALTLLICALSQIPLPSFFSLCMSH